MKNIRILTSGVIWIFGLVLAGADISGPFTFQIIISTLGCVLFAVSSLVLIKILEGK